MEDYSMIRVCEDLQEGRFDESADTAQGIPKFDRAPLIIPHGKYRSRLVASEEEP